MNKKLKIYHVQGQQGYSNWIPNREVVQNIEDADLVIFEGGEDVSPSLYGENKHPTTFNNSYRDNFEVKIFKTAKELGIPCLGICRGNQFLTVMSGGILVQDQQNPSYIHPIETYDGKVLEITSTHHQASFPFRMKQEDYKVLGWTKGLSKYHKGGDDEELNPPVECEIMYFPKTDCLGVQGHPESLDYNHETNIYLRELLSKFLNKELNKELQNSNKELIKC